MKFDIFSIEYLKFIMGSFWGFIGFLIIILTIRGDVTKWLKSVQSSVHTYLEKVKQNYKARIIRKDALPKLKESMPKIVQNYKIAEEPKEVNNDKPDWMK